MGMDAGGARRCAQLPPLPGAPPPPGPFPAIGGSARAGAGARRELPPPAPQQHSVARPAGRGGLKAAATATAAAAAAEPAAAGGGDSGRALRRPVRSGAGPGHLCPAAPLRWWPGAGARWPQTPLCMSDGAQPPAEALPVPQPEALPARLPLWCSPRTWPGVSTAGSGWAGLGSPCRGSAGPAGAVGRPAAGPRCGAAAPVGAGRARAGGPAALGRARAGPGVGARWWPRGRRPPPRSGRGGPLLRGSAALGCALISGQMSEQLRGVLLTAWLLERCHCSASSSSLSLECFTLDQLPREPGEGFSVLLPLSPFHGSIPPRCACNLCLRQKQHAFC